MGPVRGLIEWADEVDWHGTMGDWVTHCPVGADGVGAEWVEATAADEDQATLVYFLGAGQTQDALEFARPMAEQLAALAGARVLSVACQSGPRRSLAGAVEAGLTAYSWLLGEGCDVALTTFVSSPSDAGLVGAVRAAAARRGLPLPAGGISVDRQMVQLIQQRQSDLRHLPFCAAGAGGERGR